MSDRTCMIEGCTSNVRTRGWCGRHYKRWLRHGDPEYIIPKREVAPRSAATHDPKSSECLQCGLEAFGKKYCSQKCKSRFNYLKRRSKSKCAYCGGPMAPRSSSSSAEPMHRGCRSKVLRDRGLCSRCHREMDTTHNRTCWRCKSSSDCSECSKPAIAKGLCGTHYSKAWRNTLPEKKRAICAWCGESMKMATTSNTPMHSSCRKSAKHAGMFGQRFVVSPIERQAIYERDNWNCQLCLVPVERDASYQDNWAPTLDHIEPQTVALIPDHSTENLRTAHRWCNSYRGDRAHVADEEIARAAAEKREGDLLVS